MLALLYGPLCAAPPAPCTQPAQDANQLARQFGAGFVVCQSEHFILIRSAVDATSPDPNKVLEPTYRQFCESFQKAGFELQPPAEPLVWVCFPSQQSFNAYASSVDHMDMSWLDSYYSAHTNRVVVAPSPRLALCQVGPALLKPDTAPACDAARALHEAAHQMAFNTGLQKRGVMYPLWLSEGLATNCEPGPDGRVAVGRDNAPRRMELVNMLERNRIKPLAEVVCLTRVTAGGTDAARDLYAQSWGLFRFLLTQRAASLKEYMAALSGLDPGRRDPAAMTREFIQAFGALDKVEESYTRYVRSLGTAARK